MAYWRTVRDRLELLLSLIGSLWLVEAINAFIFGQRLNVLGIEPRHLFAIWHIPIAPLLHGNFAHLMANTGPLLLLGWLVLLRGRDYFWTVTWICALASGIGIWLFGAYNSVHIGASGVIFGYFGFLVARAYYERSAGAILVALAVMFLYGGMILGVLPGQPHVSWQGHFFGFVGGLWAASQIRGGRR